MKIAFGMIVFNGGFVLEECLKSVYPFAHQILIAEGPVGYWQSQGFTTSTDETNEIYNLSQTQKERLQLFVDSTLRRTNNALHT